MSNLKLDVHTSEGKTNGCVDLPAEIFDTEASIALMHQVVNAQLAAARQGTHATKTRGDVRGGGRKPFRQKGTGRARQGSIRAPHMTGGGVVHGPTPRDYSQRTPKKMIAAAAMAQTAVPAYAPASAPAPAAGVLAHIQETRHHLLARTTPMLPVPVASLCRTRRFGIMVRKREADP